MAKKRKDWLLLSISHSQSDIHHQMEGNLFGVRKGAWTKEEDDLLRHFIGKHGEGKWHQVPLKAGLNRCRKSCRLRWLNYLKPNIKRGEFTEDEIDLIIRLHKLLGNRWSLIAGRLLGRTANDVKNYWNTQQRKQMACDLEKKKDKRQETTTTSTIIRPQPRTFKKLPHLEGKAPTLEHIQSEENFSMSLPTSPPTENGIHWWKTLLDEENLFTNFWDEDMAQSARLGVHSVEEGTRVGDFSFYENLWNFSRDEESTKIQRS